METWGPEEWAGRARMAQARLAAGRILRWGPLDADGKRTLRWETEVVLDRLDREAIERLVRSPP